MPLHRERESRRRLHAEGLDEPIHRPRLDGEIRAQPVDALPVQRVHADAVRARERLQHAARFEDDVVRQYGDRAKQQRANPEYGNTYWKAALRQIEGKGSDWRQ